MKFKRMAVTSLAVASLFLLSNSLSVKNLKEEFSASYPALACPPTASNLSGQVSTGSSKVPYRLMGGKIGAFAPVKNSLFQIDSQAVLLEGGGVTALLAQREQGKWEGVTLCKSSDGAEWFVGGSADVTSKGRLILVNSGLSEASASVDTWSERGSQVSKVFTIGANSSINIGLDILAAGQSQLVFRVTPLSGRVSSFMVDERRKGLQSLGGDLINSAPAASTELTISGIPQQRIKGKSLPHILRLITPGPQDAHIKVDLISNDGVFTPLGLDGLDLRQGVVTDILLDPTISTSAFSLRIHSDQPIVAGVFSPLTISGHRDFLWNSTSPQLTPMVLAINGLSTTLIFTGRAIQVKAQLFLPGGKISYKTILGSEIAIWKPPIKTQRIEIISTLADTYGNGLVTSSSGVGFFPLTPGASLNRAPVPKSDIYVINR